MILVLIFSIYFNWPLLSVNGFWMAGLNKIKLIF
jgi:hypothetical protein